MKIDFRSLISSICLMSVSRMSFEPPHDKTNKMTCAPSEDSDQPGHKTNKMTCAPNEDSDQPGQSSQCAQWVAEDPMLLHADSEDSDQTGQMPRLI